MRPEPFRFQLKLSVVVTSLKEIDSTIPHQVDDPMFLGEASRPGACEQMLQWLWFTDSGERITQNGFDKVNRLECDLAILFDPISQIIDEFGMKYRNAFFCFWIALIFAAQVRAPCAKKQYSLPWAFYPWPCRERSVGVRRFSVI